MKNNIVASPNCKNLNKFTIFAIRKNSGLNPKTAIALEDQTMKALSVIPKTVGIESTANTISVEASTNTVRKNGVAIIFFELDLIKNLYPWYLSETFMNLENIFTKILFLGSGSLFFLKANLYAVKIKNIPKIIITQPNLEIIATPTAIKIALAISAPTIPNVRALIFKESGTEK